MEEIQVILKELAIDLNTLKENQLEDRMAIRKLNEKQEEIKKQIPELQDNPYQKDIDYTDIDYGGYGSFIDGISTSLVKISSIDNSQLHILLSTLDQKRKEKHSKLRYWAIITNQSIPL